MTTDPHTAEASRLAAIWSDVLDTPVSVDSDYFELGGDSLAAEEIAERAHSDLGIEPEMADFYALSTPREMAEALGRLRDEPTT
ncbi:acyl carrier protein [Curtobacterium sp. 9128]|uniref:acyl carrier protein n=1 Tax=Curtobacterium sp. 9128 TaxID=1793722 RepID=UPI00164236E5|nr:acyl carrier protein [Curtobacterium sp. 9128]